MLAANPRHAASSRSDMPKTEAADEVEGREQYGIVLPFKRS